MVEETVERLAPLVAPRDILTIADAGQTESLKRLLPGLPRKNFLVEPLARNTAPSLMLATARVWLEDPEAVVAALAADHLIRDPERFRTVLEAGALAASKGDHIVTFGIPPTFPSTGYGYIHYAGDEAAQGLRRAVLPGPRIQGEAGPGDGRGVPRRRELPLELGHVPLARGHVRPQAQETRARVPRVLGADARGPEKEGSEGAPSHLRGDPGALHRLRPDGEGRGASW